MNHVIHAVVTKAFANDIHLFQQLGKDFAFPGVAGNHIEDHHVALLAVAVDTSHTLLQSVGVPGNVPVDEQATELEVDAFTCCVRGNQNLGLIPHKGILGLTALIHILSAMDCRHFVATVAEALCQVDERVFVLSEDDQLLAVDDTFGVEELFELLEFLLFLVLDIKGVGHVV